MSLTNKKGGYLRILSDEEIKRIHYATLDVLENTGVKFSWPEAQHIFIDHGLKVDNKGIVKFPPYIVEDAIRKAPSLFTRYPRHHSYQKIKMGSDKFYMGPAGSATWVIDLAGKYRRPTLKDVCEFARLGDALDNFAGGNGLVWVPDYPKSVWHAIYFEAVVKHTGKAAFGGDALNKTMAEDLIRLISIVSGGEDEITVKNTYPITVCPDSPLNWGDALPMIIEAANVKNPLEIMPMPFAGSSAPVTVSGTIVQGNSEFLSAVVLTQLINPGSPVVCAFWGGTMNMQVGNNLLACPETALMNAAFSQLCRFYQIPNDAIAGTSDSKAPDAQAGYEKMMVALLPALAGASAATHLGGLIGFASIASFEQLVIDNEIAGNILRILDGVDVTEDKLAVDIIADVGAGGNYLTHKHTLKYLRDELYMPNLADKNVLGTWQAKGAKDIRQRARRLTKDILENHCPPPLEKDTKKELEKEIIRICKRENYKYSPIPEFQ